MAIFSYADFGSSFPQVWPEVVGQTQRKAPALRILSEVGRLKAGTTGDMMRWIARFSGQSAAAVNADGGAFVTAAADVRQPASLAYGSYSAPVQVTDAMRRLGSPSAGIPSQFNAYGMAASQNIKEACEALVKLIEQDLFAGLGTSNALTGMGTAITASGTYAAINSGTYTSWVSTVSGNSGVLRSLTINLMKAHLRTIAAASGQGRPDLAFCTPAVFDAVENLFDAYTQIQTTPQGGLVVPGSNPERVTKNPAVINLLGGQIKSDGFRALRWESGGVTFVECPDCTDPAATNPSNTIFFVNSGDIECNFPMPSGDDGQYSAPVQTVQAIEQGIGPLANLPFEMLARGRTKLAYEWDVTAWFGMRLKSRNAHGKLQDVQ